MGTIKTPHELMPRPREGPGCHVASAGRTLLVQARADHKARLYTEVSVLLICKLVCLFLSSFLSLSVFLSLLFSFLPSFWLISQMSSKARAGPGQAKARSEKLHLGLPCDDRAQGLSHPLRLFRVHEQESKWEAEQLKVKPS